MTMRRRRLTTGFLALALSVGLTSVTGAESDKTLGRGEAAIMDRLIQVETDQILANPNNKLTPDQARIQATNDITQQRNVDHMGWGQIAHGLGTTVGALGGASGDKGHVGGHAGANAGGGNGGNGGGGGGDHGGGKGGDHGGGNGGGKK